MVKKTTYEDEEVRIELEIKDDNLTWSSLMNRIFNQLRAHGYVIDYDKYDERFENDWEESPFDEDEEEY